MGKKFKVNDNVRVVKTGEFGVVKGREVIPVEGSKKIKIEYVVKLGNGLNNWKSYSKNELEKASIVHDDNRVYTKVYDAVNGYKLTMYTKVENLRDTIGKYRSLSMGYSIYNPNDEYNEKLGLRIARNRSRTSPFCSMSSDFSGEFNAETVEALMDVKAAYITRNFDKFINRAKKDDIIAD